MQKHVVKLFLKAQLLVSRTNWLHRLATAVCVLGGIAYFFLLPQMHAELDRQNRLLQKMQTPVNVGMQNFVASTPIDDNQLLLSFYTGLGEKNYPEQQVRTLIAVAGENGLMLNQAEYKSAYDKSGFFHTFQIIFPVKGTYPAIRRFISQSLSAIPFASVDEMQFKRDSIMSANMEARLRFTLYLRDTDLPLQEQTAKTRKQFE